MFEGRISAALKFDHGPERLRFEMQSIKLEKIVDPEDSFVQPPADYQEIEPLPF